MRVAKDATLAAVQAARAQEAREDFIDSVQAVIDEGAKLKRGADGKIDPKEKAAWLRRGVAVWRARLASLPDPNPPALRVEVDAIEAATEANDMEAVSTHSRRLFEAWKDYGVSRATFLIHKATAPFCMRLRDDMLIDLEAIQQELGRLEASADLQRWDAERDRLRRRVDATPDLAERMTPDCLNVLVDLSGSAYRLRNEIVSAMWSATPLPETTKREIATEFGSVLTPEALANMRRDTRALSVTIVTPEAERYVEREIEFNIGNLGPNWGPSVMLTIDFGDGQQTSVNAEELPKKPLIHRYKSDKPAKVVVTAAELPSSGPPEVDAQSAGRRQSRILLFLLARLILAQTCRLFVQRAVRPCASARQSSVFLALPVEEIGLRRRELRLRGSLCAWLRGERRRQPSGGKARRIRAHQGVARGSLFQTYALAVAVARLTENPVEHAAATLAAADAEGETSLRRALRSWPCATRRRMDTHLRRRLASKSAAKITMGQPNKGRLATQFHKLCSNPTNFGSFRPINCKSESRIMRLRRSGI